MLNQKVFIDSPASAGGGFYTLNLFFQDTTKVKYLAVGDHILDTANNEYEITSIANNPNIDGGQVTVIFVTNDILPTQDVDYNSTVFTPGQIDVRPPVKTAGVINSATLVDGPNYEYQIAASWADFAEEQKAQVGDSVIDANGKEYIITFIDPTNRFSVPFKAKEKEKEAIVPALGDCSLFRATPNIGMFQGTPISDPARTVARNRDDFIIDNKIKEIEDTLATISSGPQIQTTLTNGTGAIILKGTPVRADDTTKKLQKIDVSQESQALNIIGVVKSSAADNAATTVILSGVLEDVAIGAVQDVIYVDKAGALTNIKPSIGVNGFVDGDFVIKVGTLAQNSADPNKTDLIVNIEIIGQL